MTSCNDGLRADILGFGGGSAPKKYKGNDGKVYTANTFPNSSNTGAKDSRPPQLTTAERDLLKENSGCYKCRKPFAGPLSKECPHDFPTKENAIKVTQALVDSLNPAKKGKNRATVSAVAATAHTVKITSDEEAEEPGTFLTTAGSDNSFMVSAADSLPTHLWNCTATMPEGSQVGMTALLDGGSSIVLISEATAGRLNRRCRRLRQPFEITTALANIPDSDASNSFFSHFISLLVSSQDGLWSSCPVKAVIVPSLVDNVDLILGLPWLTDNRIVIDFSKNSAMVKDTDYDLLEPSRFRPRSSFHGKRRTRTDLQQAKDNFKTMLTELKSALFRRRIVFEDILNANGKREKVLHVGVAAIQARVKDVAERQLMEELDKQIRLDYSDVFGPPPHTDDLPDHKPCWVRLKDPEIVLDARKYLSPRRYQ